jgi:hypothetical protein
MLFDAWESITSMVLKNAWNRIMDVHSMDTSGLEEESTETGNIGMFLCTLGGFEACDTQNVEEWFGCDNDNDGFYIQTDEEIIQEIIGESDSDDTEFDINETDSASSPSHTQAVEALEVVMNWLERQDGCNTADLLQLRLLRNKAQAKIVNLQFQKLIYRLPQC